MGFGQGKSNYLWGCSVKPYAIADGVSDTFVREVFHLNRTTDKILNVVANAIKCGICGSINGEAAYIYTMVARNFELPASYMTPNKALLLAREWQHHQEAYQELKTYYKLSKRKGDGYIVLPEFIVESQEEWTHFHVPIVKVREVMKDIYQFVWAGSIQQAVQLITERGTIEFEHEIHEGGKR